MGKKKLSKKNKKYAPYRFRWADTRRRRTAVSRSSSTYKENDDLEAKEPSEANEIIGSVIGHGNGQLNNSSPLDWKKYLKHIDKESWKSAVPKTRHRYIIHFRIVSTV